MLSSCVTEGTFRRSGCHETTEAELLPQLRNTHAMLQPPSSR